MSNEMELFEIDAFVFVNLGDCLSNEVSFSRERGLINSLDGGFEKTVLPTALVLAAEER